VPKTKTKTTAKSTRPSARAPSRSSQSPSYRRRRSPVHGTGVFATRAIAEGEEIVEYLGERISHDEADRRHADKADDDNHTFLFTIDAKTIIDAGVGGNDSRFINHSCAPNCEVVIDAGRPIVEAIRAIAAGEELAYDYNLTRASDDAAEVEKIFACRCGAPTCRGTMLAPLKKPKKKKAAGKKAAGKKAAGKKAAGKKAAGKKAAGKKAAGKKAAGKKTSRR
jgi:uncharacterized protein